MSRKIGLDEVSKHSTPSSFWTVIHGKVYDVTKFLGEHPGGEEVILEQAGVDASQAFDDIGHSEDALDLLKDMYIGDFAGSQKPSAAPVSAGSSAGRTSASAPRATPAAAAAASGPSLTTLLFLMLVLGVVMSGLVSFAVTHDERVPAPLRSAALSVRSHLEQLPGRLDELGVPVTRYFGAWLPSSGPGKASSGSGKKAAPAKAKAAKAAKAAKGGKKKGTKAQ